MLPGNFSRMAKSAAMTPGARHFQNDSIFPEDFSKDVPEIFQTVKFFKNSKTNPENFFPEIYRNFFPGR
jgi:hypothetical protein